MTRINVINPNELNDKMLISEYRELPRISKAARHAPEAPKEYKLGKGHVLFFYDKGAWLKRRFEEELVPEMQRRGFITNYTTYRPHPQGLNKDWTPTEEAKDINRERINERLRKRSESARNDRRE